MIQIIYGNEPYLIDQMKKQAIDNISAPDFNLAEFYAWSEDVPNYLSTYPVMDDTKAAFLYLKDIKELDSKGSCSFTEYLSSPSDFSNLYIFPQKIDKRTSFFKSLLKTGIVKEVNKVSDESMLQKILLSKISQLNGQITHDAYDELIRREAYLELDDVNLFHLTNDIQSLVSYDSNVTKGNVELLVPERIVSNAFGIAALLMQGNYRELKRQAEALSNDAIGTLSALLREYRIAYKCKYFSPAEIGVKSIPLKGMETTELVAGMDIIISSIDAIKQGALSEKTALWYAFQKLIALHTERLCKTANV